MIIHYLNTDHINYLFKSRIKHNQNKRNCGNGQKEKEQWQINATKSNVYIIFG